MPTFHDDKSAREQLVARLAIGFAAMLKQIQELASRNTEME